MGAGQSVVRGAIGDPFPVPTSLTSDIAKLSAVTARVLTTPDIYDIDNLANPGVCGDYAVFLKQGIEKKLMSFVADISGKRYEVLYQNPKKAIADQSARKEICKKLANATVRTIATVLACLASIQIGSRVVQSGGTIQDVQSFLVRAGYLANTDLTTPPKTAMTLLPNGGPAQTHYRLKLTIDSITGVTTEARIHAEMKSTAVIATFPPLPPGGLRVQFLNPVPIPVAPGQPAQEILPMRILDNAGLPWAAGVLYGSVFKSLAPSTAPFYISELIERLFRKTQGAGVNLPEGRAEITAANTDFQQYKSTQNPAVLLQRLNAFLGPIIPGYLGAAAAPPPAAGPGYVGPYGPTGYGAPAVGYGAPVGYGAAPIYGGIPMRPQQMGALALVPTTASTAQYDIPANASKAIRDTFKEARTLFPQKSSPAKVRAETLAGTLDANTRTVITGACNDEYWKEPNLGKIYPWATLQFLSCMDWDNLADRTKVKFHPEWNQFLNKMVTLYSGGAVPKFDRGTTNSLFLDQIKFTGVKAMPLCSATDRPRVNYKAVQDGVLRQQGLYEAHVKKMWAILNDLILIIVDPETNAEAVRLHPKVVEGDSLSYVNIKAEEARKAIAEFYYEVEKEYVDAVKSLKTV